MATHSEEKRTDRIIMKIAPSVKEAAQNRAKQEGRSLSNYIEWLIVKDCEKNGE